MSSSWKSQGRSFNSLVKRNTSGVDVRANDRAEHRSDRDAIQVYYCPDSVGSGKDATIATAKLEFGKCAFGVEASNNLIFNDAYFGIDASANIQFTDVSGGLGRAGLFFRAAQNDENDDKPQNILLTDASGESLLIRLRPFWNPDNITPPENAPGAALINNIDPSWNYPPGSFGTNIGCPEPLASDTAHPIKGGTLGAVTIDIGGGNEKSNGEFPPSAAQRARQFAKAIGNPFEPYGGDIGTSNNDTGYFWTNYNVWKNYPKLDVASSIFGLTDSSTCIVWQTEPKNEILSLAAGDSHDISYNCFVGPPGYSDHTPIVDWTASANPDDPNHVDHPHFGLTDQTRIPAGPAGSFTHGQEVLDISQNIILKDTSGETLKFALDVDNSYNTIEYDSNFELSFRDPSWNTSHGGSLGTITIPFGKIFLDWKVGERNARRAINGLLSGIENLSDLQRPTATDRANIFIKAVNRTGWGADVSANGYYLEMDASTNPYDTSGGVILTQDYGGILGNTIIDYDPDYIDTSHNGLSLPTDVSANRPTNDPSSNYNFSGGVDGTDISQNIILSDICGNRVQFVLNVDQSMDYDEDPSGIHLANHDYPHLQTDISSVIVPMDNSGNRATGAERAAQLALAINKTNFSSFDSSSVNLFLVGTNNGDNKCQIYQEYPGVSGNMINVNGNFTPNYPDISYNTPTWLNFFPLPGSNQDSPANYPLKLQRDMDPSGGFMGGVDPVDASQTILMTASGETITKITFHLDIERQNESDASGAWESTTNEYIYFVPVGKGLGRRTSEIMVSDEMRATRFKRAVNECSRDPSNIPASGQGVFKDDQIIDFLELTAGYITAGLVKYTKDTENVPLPERFSATIGGGLRGGYDSSGGTPLEGQMTTVNIASLIAGSGSNKAIQYVPDPNKPGDIEGYDEDKIYPLIEKTDNAVVYNLAAVAGGTDSRPEYDELVRTQNRVTIVGGRHTLVYGDQDKNEIRIESIIDISHNSNVGGSGQTLSIPVWELGKGAGTSELNPKYSIQAINPSNTSGVTGAGADYSIAGGFETKALGKASVTFGKYCIAEGENSFSMGNRCEIARDADDSFSIGHQSKCEINYGCAFGYKGVSGLSNQHPDVAGTSAAADAIVDNFDLKGTNKIIFAIGGEHSGDTSGPGGNNIIEIDSDGNIWSQSLGVLSDTITPILRQDGGDPEDSGLFVEYGNATDGSTALGARSFGMGYNSRADAQGSFVDGSACVIDQAAIFSAIFGEDNTIGDTNHTAPYSFVAGKSNQALGKNSAIFGENCSAAKYCFSSGLMCDASGEYSVAMGVNNQSPGNYSVALGGANYAYGESSLALGRNSRALGVISGAIGCHSVAAGGFSVAIGRECQTGPDASNSYCLGAECEVTGIGSIALGYKSISEGKYSFVGSGGYTNADASGSIAIGYETKALDEGAISIGYDSSANSPFSVAIGNKCDVSGSWAVGLGYNSQCSGDYSFCVGKSCFTKDNYTVALGEESSAYFKGSVTMGINCLAKSSNGKEWTLSNAQTSIALGSRGSTSNYAAWIGTLGSENEPQDVTYKNAPSFRGSKKGIIFALGASGEAVQYKPNILDNEIGTISNTQDASNGNIFEIYGDGTIWSSAMGVIINPADASSVKMVFAKRGDDSTPLIKVNSGNHPKEEFGGTVPSNIGNGSVIVGNDSIAKGNYSFSSGHENRTDASYCVAMGYDCSSSGISSMAMGYKCDASNNYSVALGIAGSTKKSDSGGDISDNKLIFAIGVSSEELEVLSGSGQPHSYRGNVFEVDETGSVWTKALGTLSSTIPALGSVPIGGIIPFAGSQSLIAPTNWLWCDGHVINHVNEPKYADLFLVIGTTYGESDVGGFRVPNLQQSWPIGNADMGNTIGAGEGVTDVGNVSDVGNPGVGGSGGAVPIIMRWLIRYA